MKPVTPDFFEELVETGLHFDVYMDEELKTLAIEHNGGLKSSLKLVCLDDGKWHCLQRYNGDEIVESLVDFLEILKRWAIDATRRWDSNMPEIYESLLVKHDLLEVIEAPVRVTKSYI